MKTTIESQTNQKEALNEIMAKQGFTDYKWINPQDIIVAQWVRVKCTFGCSDYGLGTCPPNTPSVTECEKFFREYDHGIIVRLNKFADKTDYPSEWSREMTKKLLDIERAVFLQGYQKAFLLNQTCCSICNECTGTRLDCIDKKTARPSPESFAVDVYQTARKFGFEINVVSNNPAEMNRYAILLIE